LGYGSRFIHSRIVSHDGDRVTASWLNMVERFFRDITTEQLRRGVFTSVPELIAVIDAYIAHHNKNPSHSSGQKALALSCRKSFVPIAT